MTQPNSARRPLLPLRRGVLLPGTVAPVPVGRPRSLTLAQNLKPGAELLLAVQFDTQVDDPAIADLHPIAVIATLIDKRGAGQDKSTLLCETLRRVKLRSVHPSHGFWEAEVDDVDEPHADSETSHALAESLRAVLLELVDRDAVRNKLGTAPSERNKA